MSPLITKLRVLQVAKRRIRQKIIPSLARDFGTLLIYEKQYIFVRFQSDFSHDLAAGAIKFSFS
jgi:hypothetical protein